MSASFEAVGGPGLLPRALQPTLSPVRCALQPSTLRTPDTGGRTDKAGTHDAAPSAGLRRMQASASARFATSPARPELTTIARSPRPAAGFARKSSTAYLAPVDRGDDGSASPRKCRERLGQDRELVDLQLEAKEHSAWPWTSSQQEALNFQALPATVPTSPIGTVAQPIAAPTGAAVEALVLTVGLDAGSAPLAGGERGLWEQATKGNEEVLAALSALRDSLCSQITAHCRQQLVQLRGDLEEQCSIQQGRLGAAFATMQQQSDQWRSMMQGTLQEDIHLLRRDVSRIMEHQDMTDYRLQAAVDDLREEYWSLYGSGPREGAPDIGAEAISSVSPRLVQEFESDAKQRCDDVSTFRKEVNVMRKSLEADGVPQASLIYRPASLNLPVGRPDGSRGGSIPGSGKASRLNPPSGLPHRAGTRGTPASLSFPIAGMGNSLVSLAAPPPPKEGFASASESLTRSRSECGDAEPNSSKLRGHSGSPTRFPRRGGRASTFSFRSSNASMGTASVGGTSGGCSN